MLVKSGVGIDATYNYLSTVEAETGSKVKKEFATSLPHRIRNRRYQR